MDWKIKYSTDVNSPKLIFNSISIKTTAKFLVDRGKLILKLIWKSTGLRIAKTILIKENIVERITLLNIKPYYIVTTIKTVYN